MLNFIYTYASIYTFAIPIYYYILFTIAGFIYEHFLYDGIGNMFMVVNHNITRVR